MRRYIVFIPNIEESIAQELLPKDRYQLDVGLWVVGSAAKTPSDLCDELKLNKNPGGGLVVSIADYYGYYDRALWQRLDAWAAD